MKNEKRLGVFYAVTGLPENGNFSLYEAKIDGDAAARPLLTKLAHKGKSTVPVGQKIENGTMLAITERLMLFVPEGSGRLSPASTIQRDIVLVNTHYHGGHTSPIIGLFLSKEDAERCLGSENLMQRDPRWKNETVAVLRAIGTEHPFCSISVADHRWWLLPPREWQQPEAAAA